jgi:hypothetical protein
VTSQHALTTYASNAAHAVPHKSLNGSAPLSTAAIVGIGAGAGALLLWCVRVRAACVCVCV